MSSVVRSSRASCRVADLNRRFVLILFLFPAIGQSQGVEHLPGDSRITVPAMLAAVHSGKGLEWAAALQSLARAPENFASAIPDLDVEVRSVEPGRRLRALMAIGAIAQPAPLRWTVAAVEDPISAIRDEAIFALSRSDNGSDAALTSLFRASSDTTLFAKHARDAIDAIIFDRSPKMSPTFVGELRGAFHSPSPGTRLAAISVVGSARLPWGFSETLALLRDSVPYLREHAADAMRGWGPASTAARPELERLARDDPDLDVRKTASEAMANLGKVEEPYRRPVCSHRPITGLIPMEFIVAADSRSLRGDGRGPYRQGDGAVRSSQSFAYNLLLPFASVPEVPTVATDSTLRVARKLSIDLSSPAPDGGGRALGVISDSTARFHTFFMIDHRGTIWNIRDIPVLGRIASDRTEIRVGRAGRQYSLVFGPWAFGQCRERYAHGGMLTGNGTTPVSIERVSENDYRISASRGAKGRLWDITDLTSPQDRGLYYFSFEVTVRKQ